jgi:uncharacterized protein
MSRELRSQFCRLMWALGVSVLLFAAPSASADTAIPKAPERWVTDTAGMLSEGARTALDRRLADYEAQTGHQIVIWIGKSIGAAPLDDFAVKAFQAWGIGRKGHDDGVLVLVLAQDRAIDIEVGYGLEGRITDALAHRIIDEVMAPKLRAGDPDTALSAGVDAILAGIEGHPVSTGPKAEPVHDAVPRLSPGAVALLIVLGVLFVFFAATHPAMAAYFLFSIFNGGSGSGGRGGGFGGGGFSGGGGRSGGGGARGGW